MEKNKFQLVTDILGCEPVEPGVAAARAAVCVKCPLNRKQENLFTSAVSSTISKLLELKTGSPITTPYDADLHTCTACDCPMKLKVFMTIDLIRSHTKPGVFKEFYHGCWIKKELCE